MQKGQALIYILVGVLILVSVAGGAYYFTKPKPQICAQVVTWAKFPLGGQCQSFPTPCDVPKLWIKCTPPTIAESTRPTPSPIADETANWKTYTSKNCGFSFKYPANWETYSYGHTPNEEPLDYCGSTLAEERFLRPKGTEAASMDIQISPLKDIDYSYLEKSFKDGAQVKNASIENINMLSKVISLPNGKRVGSALFKNGNYVYQLSTLDENSINILNQILSTFKFQ